jgi:uncharacterized protein (TIGR02996 family)
MLRAMASVMAIVSKAVFEKEARGLAIGDVWATASYGSQNKTLAALDGGGDLYLVTVRPPETLTLVGILRAPKHSAAGWTAKANTTPIRDVHALRSKLTFSQGQPLPTEAGKLGMSLQTPRALSDEDVALLSATLGRGSKSSKKSAAKPAAAKTTKASLEQTISKDLEAALAAGSKDDFLVYADALIERGDPRGELIHLQHRGKTKDAAKLLKANADALLGPLAAWQKSLTWKLGFVDTAKFRGKVVPKRAEYDAILAHPSMKYVRELDMLIDYSAAPGVVLALAAQPRPALRSLVIDQGYEGEDEDDSAVNKPTYGIEWGEHDHKKMSHLWVAIRNVEKLRLMGWNLFHGIDLPELRELDCEGHPVCDQKLNLPKVESITWTLDCDDTGTGVDWPIETISPAWKAKAPKLRTLDLDGCSSVGYQDYEMAMEDSDGDDDEDDIDDHLAWALRRDKPFKKVAAQLDLLVLPGEKIKGKAAIAKWLKA